MDGCGVVVVIVVSGKREEGRKQNKKEKEKKKESIRRYWWWHCSWCGRELRRGLVGGVVEEIFFSSPWFGLNFCALSLSPHLFLSFSLIAHTFRTVSFVSLYGGSLFLLSQPLNFLILPIRVFTTTALLFIVWLFPNSIIKKKKDYFLIPSLFLWLQIFFKINKPKAGCQKIEQATGSLMCHHVDWLMGH